MRFLFPTALLSLATLAGGCGNLSSAGPPMRPVFQGPSIATLGDASVTVTLRLDTFGLQIADAGGNVLLDTLDTDPGAPGDTAHAYGAFGATHHSVTFAPELIAGWDSERGTDDPWHHGTLVANASWTASSAALDLFDPADPATTFHLEIAVDGAEVRVDGSVAGGSVANPGTAPAGVLNQMGQSFVLPADEHFFGLGERYVTVDHRGRHYECWVEEGGIPQGESAPPGPTNPAPNGPGMTYMPIPFFLSSRGYGLWLETTYRTGFSLGADTPGAWRLYAAQPEIHYHVLVHQDPRDTLAHYTQLTGRTHLPAPWVFGPRRRVNHGAMVNGVPEEQALRNQNVPTTMIDDATHFLPNASQVGQQGYLAGWASDMHALGYKAIGYYNPYVNIPDPESGDNAATGDLLAYGRSHGYFLKLDDGSELQTFVISGGGRNVVTIDLTNPDAVAWFQSILEEALDLGYDGWMLDFGEYVPENALFHDGRSGWEAHNAFPVFYDASVLDYLQQVRGDDFMFFARSGYAGSQAVNSVVWSGDPAASFDDAKGLPAQVRAGINAGLSGIPFWGSDISGYTCYPDPPADKEVYLRWAEFGAFSSDMHDENACVGLNGQLAKWTLWSDAETTQVYGQYALLHTRLNPYIYAAAEEAVETGLPILRHPVLLNPGQPDAYALDSEYYFGPSLYVAPVVRRGSVSRDLWLPPGTWFDWWTMAPVTGGAHLTRAAPLDVLPLYLMSGGIVAMLDPSVVTLAPASMPGIVSAGDVTGVLDVRAAIDLTARSGHAALVDGTVFNLALGKGAMALPVGVTEAPDEATLSTCSLCGRLDPLPGGAVRVRVSGASVSEASLAAGALTLQHSAVNPLRVRWDVAVLPSL